MGQIDGVVEQHAGITCECVGIETGIGGDACHCLALGHTDGAGACGGGPFAEPVAHAGGLDAAVSLRAGQRRALLEEGPRIEVCLNGVRTSTAHATSVVAASIMRRTCSTPPAICASPSGSILIGSIPPSTSIAATAEMMAAPTLSPSVNGSFESTGENPASGGTDPGNACTDARHASR